jgi:hypothetical protein
VNAHGYGKRFIVRAEEILTAFLELQRAIHAFAVSFDLLDPRKNVRFDEKLTAFVELESAIETKSLGGLSRARLCRLCFYFFPL